MLMITGSREGHLHDPQRALVVTASQVGDPHIIAEHSHERAQLLFSASGNLTISLDKQQWLSTATHAVYIPPDVPHDVSAVNPVAYRSIFIDKDYAAQIKLEQGMLMLTPLVCELVNEASTFGEHYRHGTPEARLIEVLADQLARLRPACFAIRLPRDNRLLRICQSLVAKPDDDRTLQAWAKNSGASLRTLTRLFREETGMSFVEWRQHLRIACAIQRIQSGEAVSSVALDLGYNSVSAFTAMFRQVMGASPRQYLSQHHAFQQ